MFSGVQEQLQVRGGQEEPDCLQGLPSPQVSHGRHVQVGLKVIYAGLIYNIIIYILILNLCTRANTWFYEFGNENLIVS